MRESTVTSNQAWDDTVTPPPGVNGLMAPTPSNTRLSGSTSVFEVSPFT